MKHMLVICDPETEYARRLMEFINRKKSRRLKAVAFDSFELAEKFIRDTETDILLISEVFYNNKTVKELKVMKKIILTEERETEPKEDVSLYKFYPGDVILREVENAYEAELRAISGIGLREHSAVIYGIYSPVGGSGKTSFALTLGQELAKDHRVLYMNMESCSALEEVLGVEKERNISDLVYYARQGCRDLKEKLSEMTVSVGNLDCIMPVTSYEDISCTSASEWMDIIDRIAAENSYDFILIEPSGCLPGFMNIMECCTEIFMPYRGDVISLAKIDSYERMMVECGAGDVVGKTVKVRIPYFHISGLGRNYYESLIWSELGDCVRQLIRKEKIA